MTRFLRMYGLLIGVFVAQVVFWSQTRYILPNMDIVPEVPARETVKALSLGDEQFYFRVLALQIQNAGDTYGRFTPLKYYDYEKLSAWFRLLDLLDNKSDYIPTIATYYYSQTQNTADIRYVVDYLQDYVGKRVETKWWWLIQAMYLANHKLEDKALALRVGLPLINARTIPLWARQFPAFIYEQQGDRDQAMYVMNHVLQQYENKTLPQADFNFMKYFFEERINEELPEGFETFNPEEAEKDESAEKPVEEK